MLKMHSHTHTPHTSGPVVVELGGSEERGAELEASLRAAADNMELAVAGGNHDMIPTPPEVNMPVSAEVRWGAGEWGTPDINSTGGVPQSWEDREGVEGEKGTGGVPICFCWLPGENGASWIPRGAWSVSMTTRGDPEELGALPTSEKKNKKKPKIVNKDESAIHHRVQEFKNMAESAYLDCVPEQRQCYHSCPHHRRLSNSPGQPPPQIPP